MLNVDKHPIVVDPNKDIFRQKKIVGKFNIKIPIIVLIKQGVL